MINKYKIKELVIKVMLLFIFSHLILWKFEIYLDLRHVTNPMGDRFCFKCNVAILMEHGEQLVDEKRVPFCLPIDCLREWELARPHFRELCSTREFLHARLACWVHHAGVVHESRNIWHCIKINRLFLVGSNRENCNKFFFFLILISNLCVQCDFDSRNWNFARVWVEFLEFLL